MIKENEYGKSCCYKKSTGNIKAEQLPKCYMNQKEVHKYRQNCRALLIFKKYEPSSYFFMHIICARKMPVNERSTADGKITLE